MLKSVLRTLETEILKAFTNIQPQPKSFQICSELAGQSIQRKSIWTGGPLSVRRKFHRCVPQKMSYFYFLVISRDGLFHIWISIDHQTIDRRAVRQRSVRQETTMAKKGTLSSFCFQEKVPNERVSLRTTEVHILYPKIHNFRICLPKIIFSIPKKILYSFFHNPKNSSVFFSLPKRIPASFIDPKNSLLAKISDPKKLLGPPVIKICEWGPWDWNKRT